MRMMTFAALLFLSTTTAVSAEMTGAVLVADDYECKSDHMVFPNNSGFINAEWFGGLFTEGQLYFGDFDSYGMTDVYNRDGNEIGRVWVDDFWVSNRDATGFCYED